MVEELRKLVEQWRKTSPQELSKFLDRCERKIREIPDQGIADRLRRLLSRVIGIDPEADTPEHKKIFDTRNGLYRIRSSLAHGGKMRTRDLAFRTELMEGLQVLQKMVTETVMFRWEELRAK